jgi:putative spermidine/putrescine transport system permease protein
VSAQSPSVKGTVNLSAARRSRRLRLSPTALLVPATVFLLVFFGWPVVNILKQSLFHHGFTVHEYTRAFEPAYRNILLHTVEIALSAAGLSLLFGYPTAYVMARARPRLRVVMILVVSAAYLSNPLARNYAWIFMLGNRGVINDTLLRLHIIHQPLILIFNRTGLLIGMVHILMPTVILVLLATMVNVGDEPLRAAASLAARPFTAFRRAYFPQTMSGVVAGFVLAFVIGSAIFTTAAMLGGQGEFMMSNEIVDQVQELNWAFAGALAVILLAVILVAIVVVQRFFGAGALVDRGGVTARNAPVRVVRVHEGRVTAAVDAVLNPCWRWLNPLVAVLVMVYLSLPLLIILPISLGRSNFISWPPSGITSKWYRTYASSPEWLHATANSFEIAGITTLVALVLGLPAALGLARSRSRFRGLVLAFMLSPLIIPNIIAAIGILFFFSKFSFTGNIYAVAVGDSVEALPLATLVMLAALRNFDPAIERAAASLGAGPLRTIFKVTLPILAAATATAALFAFMHSFNSLLMAMFVGGINATTLSKQMWQSLDDYEPTITAVSMMMIGLALIAFLGLRMLQRRDRTAASRTLDGTQHPS